MYPYLLPLLLAGLWSLSPITENTTAQVTVEILSKTQKPLPATLDIFNEDGELLKSYQGDGIIKTSLPQKSYLFSLTHCDQQYDFKGKIHRKQQHIVLVIEEGECGVQTIPEELPVL
ncbi:hypothetical protein [Algivirga pacifica]|uniref:Uncharacterized protein n=1 Tax=Algivirga pacifica TaxID=1162670 RepID=A0ABP9D1S4_9BACT